MSVYVRFVPRSRSQSIPMEAMAGLSSDSAPTIIRPTKANAERGQERLAGGGIASFATEMNRVSTEVPVERFAELFGAPPPGAGDAAPARGSALTVPDALADVFDFAYVPQDIDYHATLALPPVVPHYHLRVGDVALALNAPRCHQQGYTGKGVKVAMTDTGFWPHPFFVRNGYTLYPTESPGSGPADVDDNGHGTGESANIFAMAPQCTVYGVKQGGSAAGALETAIALKPQIVTNSWGWSIDQQSRDAFRQNPQNISYAELVDLESLIGEAVDNGICIVFSAGNGHFAFPGCLPKVISVGGVTVTEDGELEASSYASSFESQLYPGRAAPDICGIVGHADAAPMTGHIMLPVPPGAMLDGENFGNVAAGKGWGVFSGTSAAAPQIAGLIALLKQIRPNLTVEQIRTALRTTATDVVKGKTAHGKKAVVGPDLATGTGLVDALKACGYI